VTVFASRAAPTKGDAVESHRPPKSRQRRLRADAIQQILNHYVEKGVLILLTAKALRYLAPQLNEMPMSPGFPPGQSTIWNFSR
jgi:hypothetical protein